MDDLLKEIQALDQYVETLENSKRTIEDSIKDNKSKREELAGRVVHEMLETGCTQTEFNGFKYGIRNNPPKVLVTDEKLIPPKYFKETTTTSLDKTLLKTALKTGATIQGATLDNGSVSLTAKGIS